MTSLPVLTIYWLHKMRKIGLLLPVLYLRSTLFLITYTLLTIIYTLPMVCSAIAPLKWRYRMLKMYLYKTSCLLKWCCGLSYRVQGIENLPASPSIVFAKHQSTWETLSLQLFLPSAVYVAKRELLWIPFFGWGMSVLRFITIDRSRGSKAMTQLIEQAKDRLAKGMWIVIFPEGTRQSVGAPPNYKKGGAAIAARTGAPVVPMALNSGEFWPKHSLIKWPGEITVSIGPAIDTQGQKADAVMAQAQQWIEKETLKISRPNR